MKMHNDFHLISPAEPAFNAIRLIGDEWMLITAGSLQSFNTMTASWGGLGVLWNKPVAFIFIRPQRYTYKFVEMHDLFTCSFFDSSCKPALQFCGAHSGRDVDKPARTGLQPCTTPSESITFCQAGLFLECRKLYSDDIRPSHFIDPAISRNYPSEDYHRMYIGEIVNCGLNQNFLKKYLLTLKADQ